MKRFWLRFSIALLVAMMRAGTFDAWWLEHRADIVRKFIGGYKPTK